MIAEETEFQISQYVDGTLCAADRQMVDDLLQRDSQAREILADYRRLNSELARMNAGPAVEWDRMADHVSSEIDRQTAPVIAGRIGAWATPWRLRIAAAFLVAGTGWMVFHRSGGVKPPQAVPPSSSVVSGPQVEVATGPGVMDVAVGPSEAAKANASRYGGASAIETRPSRVTLSGLNPSSKRDSHLH